MGGGKQGKAAYRGSSIMFVGTDFVPESTEFLVSLVVILSKQCSEQKTRG
jgi:hypothetical protein